MAIHFRIGVLRDMPPQSIAAIRLAYVAAR